MAGWECPPYIRINNILAGRACDYYATGVISIPTEESCLASTCLHELFHCFQQSYVSREFAASKDWVIEGTARWMEDELYDNLNKYILEAEDFYSDTPLNEKNGDSEKYSCSLFWIYLSKNKGVNIRGIFEKLKGIGR